MQTKFSRTRLSWSLALMGFIGVPAAAYSADATFGQPYYFFAQGSGMRTDTKHNARMGAGGSFGFGMKMSESLDVELNFDQTTHDRDDRSLKHTFRYGFGAAGLFNLSRTGSIQPYLSVGAGGTYIDAVDNDSSGQFATLGIGARMPIEKLGLTLRADLKALGDWNSDTGYNGKNFIFNQLVNVGIQMPFGAPGQTKSDKPLFADTDTDGVVDEKDKCANTKSGAEVDGKGCSLVADSDNDGVADDADSCPDTAKGADVDGKGCEIPKDKDKDGVIDSKDKCPNTPEGDSVDGKGCTLYPDTDGDGVIDPRDKCPDSPEGEKVGGDGCPFVEVRDADADGVTDDEDKCPDSTQGAKVDAAGCEIKPVDGDSDGDGVLDSKDKCADTPEGAEVDKFGCVKPEPVVVPVPVAPEPEKDSDEDGVFDSKDKCPDTEAGVGVDAAGCPFDKDGDGVVNAKDVCEGTPKGTKVDGEGCELPQDADNDGVFDKVDQCADTPEGTQVDAEGCPVKETPKEVPPAPPEDSDKDGVPDAGDKCPHSIKGAKVAEDGCMVAQALTLKGVYFETNSARLVVNAKTILDNVAQTLSEEAPNRPNLQIEIGGHADSSGDREKNRALSEARAASVRNYLVGAGVSEKMLTSKGYGDSKPKADNATPEGREENRRVELVVVSP